MKRLTTQFNHDQMVSGDTEEPPREGFDSGGRLRNEALHFFGVLGRLKSHKAGRAYCAVILELY